MNRRSFLLASASLAILTPHAVEAASPPGELRIGYQKTAVLLAVKARKQLEARFGRQGVTVLWVEFPLRATASRGSIRRGS